MPGGWFTPYSSPLRGAGFRDPSLTDVEHIGSIGGASYGLTVQAGTAYLGEGTTVTILDVRDATNPHRLATLALSSLVWDMDIEGSLLFVANGRTGGIQIVDVSTPSAPHVVGTYDTPGVALRVDVVGDRAYVADSNKGLLILDVSTPTDPTLLGTYTDIIQVSGVQVDGSTAYVSDVSLGLLVLDVSTPTTPTLLGTYASPQYSWNVRLEDGLVYLVSYDGVIHIIDVSTPTAPTNAGTYQGLSDPQNFFVANSMVYVADGVDGFRIVDVSTPAEPFLVGHYQVSSKGHHRDVVVQDDRAYLASNNEGLLILDVSQPTVPTLLGSYAAMGWVYDVQVHEGYTYLAAGVNGLVIADSQDGRPVGAFTFPAEIPGLIEDLDVVGTTAYVTTYGYDVETSRATSTLLIYDIRVPEMPELLGHYQPRTAISQMEAAGTLVYLETSQGSLLLVDVSDPANPVLRTTYSSVSGVYADSTTTYLTSNEGLMVLDVSDPISPTVVGTNASVWGNNLVVDERNAYLTSPVIISPSLYLSSSLSLMIVDVDPASADFLKPLGVPYGLPMGDADIRDMAVADGRAYLISITESSQAKLTIIDVSDPARPTMQGTYHADDWIASDVHVAITGDYAYLSTGDNRLDILNVSDPTAPQLVRSYVTSHFYTHSEGIPYASVSQIAIRGDQAFLAATTRFEILDISDPANPTYAGGYTSANPGEAFALEVSGDVVYLAGAYLDIIRMHSPTTPQLLGHYPSTVLDVFVQGSSLYLAEGPYGLRILDVSTPTHPRIVGHYDTRGIAQGIYVEAGRAYVADGPAGLHILDVEDPSAIKLLGSYDTTGYAHRLQVQDTLVYLVDGIEGDDSPTGLRIIDVSNPTAPGHLSSYETSAEAMGILLDGHTAYVSTASYDGVQILDVSNPKSPTLVGQIPMPGISGSIQKVGDTFHVATWQAGYQIMQVPPTTAPSSTTVYLPIVTR
ncbi:MAG: hypothetical protein HC884_17370 [Chloroflexaceae bacterium]|nr:hypothetical protein [Chloroflexaceae bacterium]